MIHSDLHRPHFLSHSFRVLKLFLFPRQPPYVNSWHFLVTLLKYHLGKAARQGPVTLGSLQKAGTVTRTNKRKEKKIMELFRKLRAVIMISLGAALEKVQGWRSGESTRLSPMWAGFDS